MKKELDQIAVLLEHQGDLVCPNVLTIRECALMICHLANSLQNEMENCPSCNGRGEWECECCSGANGCDCHGELVQMGCCNVCKGEGKIRVDREGINLSANCEAIAGRCFLGSGPTSGIWADSQH